MRKAVGSLNSMFGVQLGTSVCALCITLFFDIYYETFHAMGNFTLSTLIEYFWILQNATRYIGIILISHFTTKQVIENHCKCPLKVVCTHVLILLGVSATMTILLHKQSLSSDLVCQSDPPFRDSTSHHTILNWSDQGVSFYPASLPLLCVNVDSTRF